MQNTINANNVISIVSDVLASDDVVLHFDPAPEEATPGIFANTEELNLCKPIKQFLATNYPDGLYTHQATSIESIQSGPSHRDGNPYIQWKIADLLDTRFE